MKKRPLITLIAVLALLPGLVFAFPHIVKKGETLREIAADYGVDWRFITGYENPDLIYPDQQLEIPEEKLGGESMLGATVCYPLDGCTGLGSATGSDVGKFLKVSDDSPFTYEFDSIAGLATTTINGASGPAFTFATSTGIGIASSAGTITFSNTGVLSANGITGAVNWLAAGPGLSVASSGQNITYTYTSSSLNLGNLSLINSPLPVENGGTATTTAPTDSQVLSASSTSPKWKTLGVSGLLTFTTSTSNLTIGFTSSSLSLGNLSVINSPLPVANGGTATGTAPFDLSILTGQGGAYAQKTLTAGTNITISTTSGAITFAATGGVGTVVTTTPYTAGYLPAVSSTGALTNSTAYQSSTRIGIGTISPSTTLHVVGGLNVTASTSLTSTTVTGHATATTATITGNFNASSTAVITGIATFQNAINQAGAVNSIASTTVTGNATATTISVTASSSFGANAFPTTNDGASLGNTNFKWSDLFLASTSVINFSSGDLTITHATDTLTFGGGTFDFGSSTALVLPRAVGGTTVDATGEATVDSTARTLNFYDGTAEVVLNPERCSAPSYTIQNWTTSSTGDVLQYFKVTSTITQVNVSGKALGNTFTGNIYASTSRQAATSTSRKVFVTDTAFGATTTIASSCYASATSSACSGGTFGANGSTTISANTFLMWYANSASTTQSDLSWCWRENP